MLTILPKRPASPPSLMSPSKRAKTPSPQKDLVKGVFSPTIPSSFRAKLEAIRLRPTTTTAPVYPIIRFHEGTADGRIPQVSGEKDCKDMPITVSGSLCVMYRSSVEAVSDIAAAVPEPNEKNPRKQLDFNSAASSASSIPKSLVIPSIIEMGFSLVSPGYVLPHEERSSNHERTFSRRSASFAHATLPYIGLRNPSGNPSSSHRRHPMSFYNRTQWDPNAR